LQGNRGWKGRRETPETRSDNPSTNKLRAVQCGWWALGRAAACGP